MGDITHINIIVCKMLGDIILSFDMKSENSNTPNIGKKAIEVVIEKGYYIHSISIGGVMMHTMCIHNDYDIRTAPETRYGIRKEIKERYVSELRANKIKQLIKH